jgi:hypothetical protein
MSPDQLRRKPVEEIQPHEMDSFLKRRKPFVVRGWLEDRLKQDDPVWGKTKARVIVIPPESKGVVGSAARRPAKAWRRLTYRGFR